VLPAGTAEAFVEAASWEARLTLDDLEPGAPPVPELHPNPYPDPKGTSTNLPYPHPNPHPNSPRP